MASLGHIPVVDVHSDNIKEVWPSMILAMSSSTFIALDTELSGLGHRKQLNAKCLEDRYKNICETTKSRSILAIGLSCFQQMSPSPAANQSECSSGCRSESRSFRINQSGTSFIVQTFNILLLCEDEFVVEPLSLKFLIHHGFDFNRQFDKGLPYYRGVDRENDHSLQTVRHLFTELVAMKIPIVLHNGLVDIMFMYENLYSVLPTSLAAFLADLFDMFPAGIIDTKYITDFEHLMQASYLEYVFRKCQKDNEKSIYKCSLYFPHYPPSYPHVTYRDCGVKPTFDIGTNPDAFKAALCVTYSGHGWCPKDNICPKSHDIDLIIDVDVFMDGHKSRKRKRRKENREKKNLSSNDRVDSNMELECSTLSESNKEVNDSQDMLEEHKVNSNHAEEKTATLQENEIKLDNVMKSFECDKKDKQVDANGGHRAGYDAFMTGFIYAFYRNNGDALDSKISEWKNKLYLGGKDYPLSISKSEFIKQSKHHLEKVYRIRKMDSK